jgi:hypothetical protein
VSVPFVPGDRVVCIRAQSNLPSCRGRLRLGETYTVTDVREDGWLAGINVAEAPVKGAALYSWQRFERASDQ